MRPRDGLHAWLRPAAVALALLAVAAPRGTGAEERLEPRPPWLFFPEPDARTAAEIDNLVTNSFGDQNKAVAARETLVRRFGPVAVPRLVDELRRGNNQGALWNSLLTLSALRDRVGPARELWPAIEPPLVVLRGSVEPYARAFAALALGSFHGTDTVPVSRGTESALQVRDQARIAREALREAGPRIARLLEEERHPHVKVACALALAKRGPQEDGESRRVLTSEPLWQDTIGVEARQAVIVALGLLPGPGDDERLLRALRHEEARVRRAAALAVALQALGDPPPSWLRTAVPELRKALTSAVVRPALEDGAEAVFARGVLARRGDAPAEWPLLLEVAVVPASSEEAATAAAQVLLHCPEGWLAPRVIDLLRSGVRLPEPVVAAFLRIAGRSGAPEGIAVCRDYLGNKALRPSGREEFDVRYHAATGILRALASGALRDPEARKEAVAALDAGVRRGLPEGPFRDRLARLLEQRRGLLADAAAALPEADLRAAEAAFACPHGLLAPDMESAAIHRLNTLLPALFNVHSRKGTPGEPDRTDQPQRVLKGFLDRFPYFRRLELDAGRGRRSAPALQGAEEPGREVRSPP